MRQLRVHVSEAAIRDLDDSVTEINRGLLFHKFAVALREVNQSEESLFWSRKAAEHLASFDPATEAEYSNAALSLVSLSHALGDMGTLEESLNLARRAEILCSRGLMQWPLNGVLKSQLAAALHNQGMALARMGLHERALQYIEGSLKTYEQLAFRSEGIDSVFFFQRFATVLAAVQLWSIKGVYQDYRAKLYDQIEDALDYMKQDTSGIQIDTAARRFAQFLEGAHEFFSLHDRTESKRFHEYAKRFKRLARDRGYVLESA